MNSTEPDDWNVVAGAFEAALVRAAHERRAVVEAHLASRSAARPDLVEHVLQLVAHADRPHDVLDRDAARVLGAEPPPREDLTGTVVGRYRITSRIASGGMGDVYLAEHGDPPAVRRVAFKVVRRGLDSQAVLARCDVERRALAALHHPTTVAFLDAGALPDGRPYLVMEHVDGRPLTDHARAHALAVPQRVELLLAVCRAVAHAHAHLVLHRDIKPSNVFVTHEGAVKLLDFGVAKILTPASEATALPLPTTARYAAPELLLQRPATVATDVHALGLLLFELLTDEPARTDSADPFAPIDTPSSRVSLHQRRTAPSPDRQPHRVPIARPRDLDALVARATAQSPADRYATVDAFARDLERYLADEPLEATRATTRDAARRAFRRHRTALVLSAVVIALLLTLLVGNHIGRVRAERDAARGWTAHRTSKTAALVLADLLATAPLTPAFFEHASPIAAQYADDHETQALVDLALGRAALAANQPSIAVPHLERARSLARTPPLGHRDELAALHHLARARAALASPTTEATYRAALDLIAAHPTLVQHRALVTFDYATHLAAQPNRASDALTLAHAAASDLHLTNPPTDLAALLSTLSATLR